MQNVSLTDSFLGTIVPVLLNLVPQEVEVQTRRECTLSPDQHAAVESLLATFNRSCAYNLTGIGT